MTDYQMVPIDSLKPSGYNPNVLTPDQYAALVNEVRGHGRLLKPVVANETPDQDGRHPIIDGEHNWLAARDCGIETVPVELIEADDFTARRETLIRNRHGNKDNLAQGRVYQDMLTMQGWSYRDLAADLEISHGSVRNQLLYPQAWDLLREHGQRQPVEPECHAFGADAYTEAMLTKMSVRHVRDLVARLQGLTDEDGSEQPTGEVADEERAVRLLKFHWSTATKDGQARFIEWTGVLAPFIEALAQQQSMAAPAPPAKRKPGRPRKQQSNGAVSQSPEPVRDSHAADEQVWNHYVGRSAKTRRVLEYLAAQSEACRTFDIMHACDCNPGEVQRAFTKKLIPSSYARKVAHGQWVITDSGRSALAAHPEPEPVIQPAPEVNGVDNSYTKRGARIRYARNVRAITQRQLGDAAGVHHKQVGLAEMGTLTKSGGPAAGRPAFAKLEAFLGLTPH